MSISFTEISSRYERDSMIQKSAAEKLFGLLDIKSDDTVLDLGCGTGNLTRRIRTMTNALVVGVDQSEGMILQAERERTAAEIMYRVQTAENMEYDGHFTALFCNSAFQWFSDPARALRNCRKALKKGGRIAIQAPARKEYCPNFLKALEAVSSDRRTVNIFSGFRPPWIFFDTAHEYSCLFEKAGFSVPFAVIEKVASFHNPDEVLTIFESGAAAGYLNRQWYATDMNEQYAQDFRKIVKASFKQQANEQGMVELIFHRIYLVAVK